MPIYEYQCAKCGKCFEALRFSSDTTPPECPHCGSNQVERQLSCFATSAGSGGGLDLGSPAPSSGGCGSSGGFS